MAGMQACSLLKSKRYIEGALGVGCRPFSRASRSARKGLALPSAPVVSWEQRHHVHEHTPALQNSMVMLQTDAQHCCV